MSPALRDRVRDANWWVLGPLLLYAVLVLAGVTQSSIGIDSLREEVGLDHRDMVGGALAIRSDEYNTSTPVRLGATITGQSDDLNPLTAPQEFITLVPGSPVSSLVLLDGWLLRHAPLSSGQLLALHWWLPFLVLWLGAPALTRRITGSPWPGLLTVALVAFTPVSVWWSFSPLGPFAFAVGGTAALLVAAERAAERRWGRAAGWGFLAAVLLARTPLLYQPWALVLAPAVLAVGVAFLLGQRAHRRSHLVTIGATGLVSLALLVGVLVENREGLEAVSGTLYPGNRVSTGGPVSMDRVFGAPVLGRLRFLGVAASSHSEVATSFAEAAVLAVLVLLTGVAFRDRAHRWAVAAAVGGTALWLTWTLVGVGTRVIPGFSLVPPERSGPVIGLLAVLLAALVLPHAIPPRRGTRMLVAGITGLVTAYGGALLVQRYLPEMRTLTIGIASVAVMAVAFTVLTWPRRPYGYVAAVVLAVAATGSVNPIQIGTADLGTSEAARLLLDDGARARAAGDLWASDGISVDALFAATGVPSLSSRQLAGPDETGWRVLDPTGSAEQVWNRGGSYITFVWSDVPGLSFTNPATDVIRIEVSPCTLAEMVPELAAVVSTRELTDGCLTEVRTFRWGGATQWVYAVDGSA